MIQFDRPIGANADVKELEYISALHQTGTQLRQDGSIQAEDIKAYLRSRFGIEVTVEEVRWTILHGMGGSDSEGEVIDLMELTAMILIPTLLKAAAVERGTKLAEGSVAPPEYLLHQVLQILLHDVTGNRDSDVALSPELIKQMLLTYGETRMANNEALVSEMFQAATGLPEGMGSDFNVSTFAKALTADVDLYDITNEVRVSTSMEDIFGKHKVEDLVRESSRRQVNSVRHDVVVNRDLRESALMGSSSIMLSLDDEELRKSTVRAIDTLNHVFSAPEIDIQAGTYRSKGLAVSLWGCVLFGLFAFAFRISDEDSCRLEIERGREWDENAESFKCKVKSSVGGWLGRYLFFAGVGIVSIAVGSLGNYVGNSRPRLPLIGALYVLAFPFLLGAVLSRDDGGEHEPYFELEKRSSFIYMVAMSKVLAFVTAYFHICNFVAIAYPDNFMEKSAWGRLLGFAPLARELFMKTAGAHKTNQLVRNAMALMEGEVSSSVVKTYFGHGLSAFALNGESKSRQGGFFWFWGRIRDRSIIRKEGIWYSTRLLASNFTQLSICCFILLLGIDLINKTELNFGAEKFVAQTNWLVRDIVDMGFAMTDTQNATTQLTNVFGSSLATITDGQSSLLAQCEELKSVIGTPLLENSCSKDSQGGYECSGSLNPEQALCILAETPELSDQQPDLAYQLIETAGFNATNMRSAVEAQFEIAIYKAVESMYPEELWMITVPLQVGTALAVLASLRLALLYLPGVTTTILELRTGVIPSLHSPNFQKYREAPDTVTILTGSLFWGSLVSSILLGSVVGFIVFLFLWQGSFYMMLRVCAFLIGIIVIILVKLLVVMFCFRRQIYKGLYRTKPATSNVLLLALEWASFVLTSAFILVRMFKILLISVASVGNIDRRLLAEGVGQIGSLEFDPYPTIHLRDLVAHEAHRHPYIEILGTVYLMKLRYSERFGSRSGSAWRLMFVYALLPWMHQYRIPDELPVSSRDRSLNAEALVEEQQPANGTRRLPFVYALLPWKRQYRTPDEGPDARDRSLDAEAFVEEQQPANEPRRLPLLRHDATSDVRGLEMENLRLREMLDKLLAESALNPQNAIDEESDEKNEIDGTHRNDETDKDDVDGAGDEKREDRGNDESDEFYEVFGQGDDNDRNDEKDENDGNDGNHESLGNGNDEYDEDDANDEN